MMLATSHNWTPEMLSVLTAEERNFVLSLTSVEDGKWRPLPGPQTMAYESEADVVGYGGAAGGGKTDLAFGKATTKHRRTIVFRLNGTEHTAFVDRIAEFFGTRDGFNSKDGIWRDLGPNKVQLELGSVPNQGDEKKYRGRPHDLKIFDEASEIPENQVRFLLGWLRTTDPDQKCQALLCFNPPTTQEGRWVIKFFAPWLDPKHPNPAMPGELRYFATVGKDEVEVPDKRAFIMVDDKRVYDFDPADVPAWDIIKPQSRTFIPARVTDNPYLIGTNYMSTLQALPEPLRSQMLKGDFRAGMKEDPWQVIPTAWVEAAMERWAKPNRLQPMDSQGVDVARGGDDETVIARRHVGMWFDWPVAYQGEDTCNGPKVGSLVVKDNRDRAPIHIEINGVGVSPYDWLVENKFQTIGVDVGAGATGSDRSGRLRFRNIRSQMWWNMREALDPVNNTGIALPPHDKLKADLCTPKWSVSGSIITVEGRDDIIKRLKRSADYGTAYCLALMETPRYEDFANQTGGYVPQGHDPYNDGIRNSSVKGYYDPYKNIT